MRDAQEREWWAEPFDDASEFPETAEDLYPVDEANGMNRILGHRMRQRQRALNGGWDGFRNYEMIEALLGYAVPRKNMSVLARALDERYGSVMKLLLAPAEELRGIDGMTDGLVEWIGMVSRMVQRYQQLDSAPRPRLTRFSDVCDFLRPRLSWAAPNECWALYTSFEHHLMSCQVISRKAEWHRPEHVQQMAEDCLSLQARHVMIVLFREAGRASLSEAERAALDGVGAAFEALGVALIDCILVESGRFSSAGRRGGREPARWRDGGLRLQEP